RRRCRRAGPGIRARDGQLVRRVPRRRRRPGGRHLAGNPAGTGTRRAHRMTENMARFDGKGVVVTGAAQGIGRAVARAFAAEAARVMVRDGIRGAIVLTASTNAFQPEAGGLAYNTSKAGEVAVMQTAALELSRLGIRVNAIAPGIINTRLSAFVINHPVQSKV